MCIVCACTVRRSPRLRMRSLSSVAALAAVACVFVHVCGGRRGRSRVVCTFLCSVAAVAAVALCSILCVHSLKDPKCVRQSMQAFCFSSCCTRYAWTIFAPRPMSLLRARLCGCRAVCLHSALAARWIVGMIHSRCCGLLCAVEPVHVVAPSVCDLEFPRTLRANSVLRL